MSYWEFWDYVEVSGNNPFARWFSGIPMEAQAHMDDRMLLMEGMQRWPEKWASDYKGARGIRELRFPFRGVQYRPLYCYSPHVRRQLVILAGAIEKGGAIPSKDVKAAAKRLKILVEDRNRVCRRTF